MKIIITLIVTVAIVVGIYQSADAQSYIVYNVTVTCDALNVTVTYDTDPQQVVQLKVYDRADTLFERVYTGPQTLTFHIDKDDTILEFYFMTINEHVIKVLSYFTNECNNIPTRTPTPTVTPAPPAILYASEVNCVKHSDYNIAAVTYAISPVKHKVIFKNLTIGIQYEADVEPTFEQIENGVLDNYVEQPFAYYEIIQVAIVNANGETLMSTPNMTSENCIEVEVPTPTPEYTYTPTATRTPIVEPISTVTRATEATQTPTPTATPTLEVTEPPVLHTPTLTPTPQPTMVLNELFECRTDGINSEIDFWYTLPPENIGNAHQYLTILDFGNNFTLTSEIVLTQNAQVNHIFKRVMNEVKKSTIKVRTLTGYPNEPLWQEYTFDGCTIVDEIPKIAKPTPTPITTPATISHTFVPLVSK